MKKLERIEREIESLSPQDAAVLREWFLARDWETWDRQLEADIDAGKLDGAAREAVRDYESGRTSEL